QQAIRAVSTSEWEATKRLIYSEKEAAIRNPTGGMLVMGKGAELKSISEVIHEFAERVADAKSDFCRTKLNGHSINAQVLSGGGAMISLVRETLVKGMKAQKGSRIYDLLDRNEPLQALLPKRGSSGWFHEPRAVDSRLRENQQLIRGGSAMG